MPATLPATPPAEPWLVYLAIFVCAALAARAVQAALTGARGERRRAERRFASLGGAAAATELDALRRRAAGTGRSALLARLERWVLQTGTGATPARLLLAWLGLAVPLLLVLPLGGFPRVVAAAGAAAALVGLYLRAKRARRLARFGEQLPEVIDVVVRSLRAGHPLPVSLALVAREMPEPAGPEFALAVDEISYGRSIADALGNLHHRVGYPELAFLVAAVSVAHQTGGNLSEILSRLSRTLRERFRIARRVRALTAEGRFSGYALSALPIALFGLINVASARYYAEFWASNAARPVLSVALGLLVLGNLVIHRLVNFRV